MSKIEWTDRTWNPVRGCTKISPGCKNCYAKTFAERWRGVKGHPYESGFDLRLVPHKLLEPLSWKSPSTIFVNSMSDLFHEDVPEDYRNDVFEIMEIANWHAYQVLTKRADILCSTLTKTNPDLAIEPHICWGVSVEDRKHGFPRIEALKETWTGKGVRFLSIEPLLEDLGTLDLNEIDWVIVGGESGPRYRQVKREWIDSIQIQCEEANVPFFFKQWGGYTPKSGGRILNGQTYDEMPVQKIETGPYDSLRAAIGKDFTSAKYGKYIDRKQLIDPIETIYGKDRRK